MRRATKRRTTRTRTTKPRTTTPHEATARLDDVDAELRVEARALSRAARGFVYAFSVSANGAALLLGQAAIIIPEGA